MRTHTFFSQTYIFNEIEIYIVPTSKPMENQTLSFSGLSAASRIDRPNYMETLAIGADPDGKLPYGAGQKATRITHILRIVATVYGVAHLKPHKIN